MISPKAIRIALALSSSLYLSTTGMATADIYSDALKARLATDTNSLSQLTNTQRKQIIDFYQQRDFRPVWVGEYGLNTRARRLFDAFKSARRDAMDPDEYRSLLLNSKWNITAGIQHSPGNMAKLETDITLGALLYGRHASAGRVVPEKINHSVKLKPAAEPAARILRNISTTLHPEKYLESLQPRTAQYLRLKKIYGQYLDAPQAELRPAARWPRITVRGVIAPGMRHSAIVLLRQRLLGSGTGTSTENTSTVYDAKLAKAVKNFQKKNNLWPDGIIGPSTMRILNASSPTPTASPLQRKQQIALNMERWRWLPENLGKRYVLVNQPEFKLRIYDTGKIIHQARVIIGKRSHATPVFSNKLSLVVFNPNWNVPRSIATKEILPALRRDPYYLQRHNMALYKGYTGRTVNPARINWRKVSRKSFPYRIRQKPGNRNALGRIKFLFPNKYSIYLHDTPAKSLFNKPARAFSHGCVRLQNPQVLAEILLSRDKGWSRTRIRKLINRGRRRIVKLSQKIPIYLTYFTTWVDNQGNITFLKDIYGRDQKLNIVLNQVRIAMK